MPSFSPRSAAKGVAKFFAVWAGVTALCIVVFGAAFLLCFALDYIGAALGALYAAWIAEFENPIVGQYISGFLCGTFVLTVIAMLPSGVEYLTRRNETKADE